MIMDNMKIKSAIAKIEKPNRVDCRLHSAASQKNDKPVSNETHYKGDNTSAVIKNLIA